MHNKIKTEHSCTRFVKSNAETIYVADFTERTQNLTPRRSVEISSVIQMSPDDNVPMDSVVFHNESLLDIEFGLFDDYNYHDIAGNNIEHCEGTMYIADNPNIKWIAFLEIKDCLPEKIRKYKLKARTQIKNVVDDFKARGIITTENIFGIISCPQKKVAFNNTIVGDIVAATQLKRTTGINFFATNEVFIVSEDTIRPQI